VLCFAACLMLFGGLPMIGVCHDAIQDRQITNRTGEVSMKGVSMSQLGDASSSAGQEVQNPLSGLGAAIHDSSKSSSPPEAQAEKPPLWDRVAASFVHGLVVTRLCAYVDDDEHVVAGDYYHK
jgi:hypothetical protein